MVKTKSLIMSQLNLQFQPFRSETHICRVHVGEIIHECKVHTWWLFMTDSVIASLPSCAMFPINSNNMCLLLRHAVVATVWSARAFSFSELLIMFWLEVWPAGDGHLFLPKQSTWLGVCCVGKKTCCTFTDFLPTTRFFCYVLAACLAKNFPVISDSTNPNSKNLQGTLQR